MVSPRQGGKLTITICTQEDIGSWASADRLGRITSSHATERAREDRWLAVALVRTFDIAVQLSLRMEILKPSEELTDDDGNVLFSEDTRLHL